MSPVKTVLMLGCGNMGGAIVHKCLGEKELRLDFHIVQPSMDKLSVLPSGKFYPRREDLASTLKVDILFIAVKPQKIPEILPQYWRFISKDCLIMTIAAALRVQEYKKILSSTPIKNMPIDELAIIRVMPNLGVKVAASVNLIYGVNLTIEQLALQKSLWNTMGTALWLEHEEQIDSLSPICGSGMAYFYLLAEQLEASMSSQLKDSGIRAQDLVKEILLGAAKYWEFQARQSPRELRRQVSSKGGITEAATAVLEPLLKKGVPEALAQARQRAKELQSK